MQELSNVLAGKYNEIIEKITSFSNEHLNDEYKNICIEATKALFLNNEEQVKKGKSFSVFSFISYEFCKQNWHKRQTAHFYN